jgi:hypothetical protein
MEIQAMARERAASQAAAVEVAVTQVAAVRVLLQTLRKRTRIRWRLIR